MEPLGPFDVEAQTIASLSAGQFTAAINALLKSELAELELSSYTLNLDFRSDVADGAVDVFIDCPSATGMIPSGHSVWQFKSGPMSAGDSKQELTKPSAHWLRERIKGGAVYFLAIGHPYNDEQLGERKAAILEAAADQQLPMTEDQVTVMGANQLSTWVSSIPALALNTLFKGMGWNLVDHEQWTLSSRHDDQWVDASKKAEAVRNLREALTQGTAVLRVQGPSGVGKSRMVMRALEEFPRSQTVAYASRRSDLSREMLNFLLTSKRPVTLVVDECDAREHEKLCEDIPRGTSLMMISIGPPSDFIPETPILEAGLLTETEAEEYLRTNHPGVPPEAVPVLAEGSAGNVGHARWLAIKLRESSPRQLSELIDHRDIARFVTSLLPRGGESFLVAQTLALFERVGWDDDLSSQAGMIATYLDMTPKALSQTVAELERNDIVVRQGRFRSVEPHPLAIMLASEAWASHASDVMTALAPSLDAEMFMSLLRRAADLGSNGPTREVFASFLRGEELFGSLESIESHNLSNYLVQLAIVAPDETNRHLHQLIMNADLEDLRCQTRSRRGLVWALEKLAWHSRLFEQAADSLLRLSLAENETYANSATGTWSSLFGAVLPATGASPEARSEYLQEKSRSNEVAVRLRAVEGLGSALSVYESVMRSAEVQGGVFLEARGGVATSIERQMHHLRAIGILENLTADPSGEVSKAATEILVKCIHPYLRDSEIVEKVFGVLAGLGVEDQQLMRAELGHLRGLFTRVSDAAELQRIVDLESRLPELDPLSNLRDLLAIQPWELDQEHRKNEFQRAIQTVDANGDLDIVLGWLREREIPGCWHLGHYVGQHTHQAQPDWIPKVLVDNAPLNPNGMLGYLQGRREAGIDGVFDAVLDGEAGRTLTPQLRLGMTARGPVSDVTLERVRALIPDLPVASVVSALFGWHHHVSIDVVFEVISSFIDRIENQRDYVAAISWASMALYKASPLDTAQEDAVLKLVRMRTRYPEIGTERYGWARLGERLCQDHPIAVAEVIVTLARDHSVFMMPQDEEPALLRATAARDEVAVWGLIGQALLDDEWRLTMGVRGWITELFNSDVIKDWIGSSEDRAERVAMVATAGSGAPSPIAAFLLERFSQVDGIKGHLAGEFTSGSWMGPASNHYAQQIAQLEAWASNTTLSRPVRNWASDLAKDIATMRERALQMEAEGQFGI